MAEKYPLVLNGTNIEELQSGDSIAGAIDSVSQDTSPNLGGNLNTGSYNVSFGDNAKAQFGDSNDLQIYHDGTHSRISDAGSGELRLMSNGDGIKLQNVNGENMVYALNNGAVNLYYDNSQKLATTSTGVSVTGNVTATSFTGDGSNLTGISTDLVNDTTPQLGGSLDVNGFNVFFGDNEKAYFGTDNDLQIYHDGSNSRIQDVGTGNLKIQGTHVNIENSNSSELMIQAVDGGAVSLSYAGNTKLATTSSGVSITGTCSATSFSGDGSSLTGINADAFEETFHAYDSSDASAVSGWKTMKFASVLKNENSRWNNSTGVYTVPSAGYYFFSFDHQHTNGTHTDYSLRIYNNNKGRLAYAYPRDGIGQSIQCIAYCTTNDQITFQVYHNNSSHMDENDGRGINASAYKFVGF